MKFIRIQAQGTYPILFLLPNNFSNFLLVTRNNFILLQSKFRCRLKINLN